MLRIKRSSGVGGSRLVSAALLEQKQERRGTAPPRTPSLRLGVSYEKKKQQQELTATITHGAAEREMMWNQRKRKRHRPK